MLYNDGQGHTFVVWAGSYVPELHEHTNDDPFEVRVTTPDGESDTHMFEVYDPNEASQEVDEFVVHGVVAWYIINKLRDTMASDDHVITAYIEYAHPIMVNPAIDNDTEWHMYAHIAVEGYPTGTMFVGTMTMVTHIP